MKKVRKDRNQVGSAVAMYYSDNLNVRNRDELVPEGAEAVCVEALKRKCSSLPNSYQIAFIRNPSKFVESTRNYKSSAFKADLNECLFMSD